MQSNSISAWWFAEEIYPTELEWEDLKSAFKHGAFYKMALDGFDRNSAPNYCI